MASNLVRSLTVGAGLVSLWLAPVGTSGTTVSVPPGGDLQKALNAARPGDTIELAAGATYTGHFVLPVGPARDSYITLRTLPDPRLPAPGGRIQPRDAPQLAKLSSPDGQPALRTGSGAHHWRVELLEFPATAEPGGTIIALGDGSDAQSQLSQVPHDLILDRVFVHGAPGAGQRRGVALNSASTTVTGCYISEIKSVGADSQAIAGWNGPGPYTITNNYLEAAGENMMFGGADPSIQNLVPQDITIKGNTLSRPVAWRGQRWEIKNILELKNARRVTITDNLLENNWQAAQAGFAVLFTVRNQEGRCPWCRVEEVLFERNVVQHSAGGVSILGRDDNQPSEQTRAIEIRHNLFVDIDNQHWGGNGYFLLITGGPREIVVDHNTIIQEHASGIVQVEGPPVIGFGFTNNIVRHGAYGIMGRDHAFGNDTITTFFPAARVANNVIADGDAGRYPRGNNFPATQEFRRQFSAYDAGDFRLTPSSAWNNGGTQGSALGADAAVVSRRR